MFNLFKKNTIKNKDNENEFLISVASILIHAAKIDENFTNKEKTIIQDSLIEMGADQEIVLKIVEEAEIKEKDSNQILDFTKKIKEIKEEEKKIIIEALWNIIFSDKNADMYETNLMRRLSGLLYLDNKVVGEIKEKVRLKKK